MFYAKSLAGTQIMEKRDYVLSRYPDAVLVEVPPISRGTDCVPLQPGYWVVYAGRNLSAVELGRGETSAGAWADAATKLQTNEAHTSDKTNAKSNVLAPRASEVTRRAPNPRRRDH
jgi:hypothetical protein